MESSLVAIITADGFAYCAAEIEMTKDHEGAPALRLLGSYSAEVAPVISAARVDRIASVVVGPDCSFAEWTRGTGYKVPGWATGHREHTVPRDDLAPTFGFGARGSLEYTGPVR